MGYELRRWLADRLPTGLSPGERLVALEVADLANDGTRRAFGTITLDTLVRRTGYADIEQVGKVLAKLALRGLELRVPVMRGGRPVVKKSGHLLFACNGHQLNFLVPDESCPALVKPSRSRDLESQRERAGFDEEARSDEDEARVLTSESPRDQEAKPACSRDPSPQSPQDSSSLIGRERIVMEALAHLGVTEDEMREVIKEVEKTTKIKIEKPIPYFRTIAERGDLVDYLNRVRAAAERRAAYAARQTAPPPEPRLEPDRPSTTPEERDSAIAAVRDLLRGTTTRRGAGGPARVARPRTAPETPPEVERAHATLARHGNALDLMDAARKRLGDQAHRNEVVVLAAELAREERPAPAFA